MAAGVVVGDALDYVVDGVGVDQGDAAAAEPCSAEAGARGAPSRATSSAEEVDQGGLMPHS